MGHREQLLAAARTLLEERGYAHITTRDLVAASDTNLASIGYHFGSKAGLLNAAIESAFEDWSDQLAALVMADDATPIQRGIATWAAALESLPKRQPILRAYFEALAQAQRSPELHAQLAAHYRRARERVAALVATSIGGGASADDPQCRAVASFVIAACDGLAVQWLLDADDVPTPSALVDGLGAVFYQREPPETSRTAGRTSAR